MGELLCMGELVGLRLLEGAHRRSRASLPIKTATRPLQVDTKYAGHLFDAFPKTGADTVKFSKAERYIFPGCPKVF